MITNKKELKIYLKKDKAALGIKDSRKFPRPFYDDVWRFQIALRKAEYAVNCRKGLLFFPYRIYRRIWFHLLSVKYGFTIPLNVFGPGLSIAHYGTIVIHSNARIGANCRIQEGVNIGSSGTDRAPTIGSNVFIGTGAKIIGGIVIANDIAIGAGSVVTRSFYEKGITIAGVPASKISEKGSKPFLIAE